jgi:predicted DNA-binding mobile mystery protein A
MSTYQLAERLGVSQATVSGLEGSEAKGTIQLATLERVAQALNCRLAYALVPNESLETMVVERKRVLATRLLDSVRHTMRLEGQAVTDSEALQREIETLFDGIKPSEVWKVGA